MLRNWEMYRSISLGPEYFIDDSVLRRKPVRTGDSANLTRSSFLNSSQDGGRGYSDRIQRYHVRASSRSNEETLAIFICSGVCAIRKRSSIRISQALTFSVY